MVSTDNQNRREPAHQMSLLAGYFDLRLDRGIPLCVGFVAQVPVPKHVFHVLHGDPEPMSFGRRCTSRGTYAKPARGVLEGLHVFFRHFG